MRRRPGVLLALLLAVPLVPLAQAQGATTPFAWHASALSAAQRAQMTGRTWRPGCPVPLSRLRMLSLSYVGFDGGAHVGALVVNADAVAATVGAFRALYAARFPVRRMVPVDAYGGSDERSMTADNTSAFNCRRVPGTTIWAQHAYGRAVDLDPLENPEVSASGVDPPAAARFADRTRRRPGMIYHGGTAWRAFRSVDWRWGGDWGSPKDYQHFSANGL
ncbi:MAG: M15 family metallopeptidase [Acidobacteriota bacterium]|nr:M15 family metallopeptidase [Acidobacteriota bacterium]